jgi:hypothetical protein
VILAERPAATCPRSYISGFLSGRPDILGHRFPSRNARTSRSCTKFGPVVIRGKPSRRGAEWSTCPSRKPTQVS